MSSARDRAIAPDAELTDAHLTIADVAKACGLPQPVIAQLVPRTWTDVGWMYTEAQAQKAIEIAASEAARRTSEQSSTQDRPPAARHAKPTIATTDLTTFLRDYVPESTGAVQAIPSAAVDFGAARMHFESADSWSTLSACMEWRAEIRLSSLDAHAHAPEVVTGSVQFLIVRAGHESPREVLPLFGPRAAAFDELFDNEWLLPELDEDDDFTGGMPISTVLLVLDAALDPRVPAGSLLRAWAVAETIFTMLPTTSGLVVMPPAPAATGKATRRLLSSEDIDQDWVRVGCRPLPGRPRFHGQATAYVHLDHARDALACVRDSTVSIPLEE
ncbi:hypothetical protein [Mycolicibacterium aromaticivorans]|uniref:hypothetical protein n=1 Tax=Mycolicibacterium aromaticivorans TaxID=318425 RepID=UPI000445FE26|nr:hypothetical protein [Mycolicibacterium aromaticivorans]